MSAGGATGEARTTVDCNGVIGLGGGAATAVEIVDAAQASGAFSLSAGSKDAAPLLTLYTAQINGVSRATGFALIEVYEVPR